METELTGRETLRRSNDMRVVTIDLTGDNTRKVTVVESLWRRPGNMEQTVNMMAFLL